MLGSVKKAFRTLEALAREAEKTFTLGEVARILGYNRATCAHLLKTLVELNYAEQLGARKGYRLGPKVFHLAARGPYRKDLVSAAEPSIARLARELRETVLLAALVQGERVTLCQIDGTRDIQVRSEMLVTPNIYETATGRTLLAYLDDDALEALLDKRGLPGSEWSEVSSRKGLDRTLADIRRQGMVVNVTASKVVGIGCPVLQKGRVVAALGLFLPEFRFVGPHKQEVLRGVKRTAEEIGLRLSSE